MANVDYFHKDFFILLDRLDLTLTEKIEAWKKDMPSGIFAICCQKKKEKLFYEREKLFYERLMVGHDLSLAIAYLHKKKIAHRDLVRKSIYMLYCFLFNDHPLYGGDGRD